MIAALPVAVMVVAAVVVIIVNITIMMIEDDDDDDDASSCNSSSNRGRRSALDLPLCTFLGFLLVVAFPAFSSAAPSAMTLRLSMA